MRIDSGLTVQSQLEVERAQKKPACATEKNASGVTAEFSPDAVSLSSLFERLSQAPDIREEKVKALRDAISSGTYQVSDEALADAILRDVVIR